MKQSLIQVFEGQIYIGTFELSKRLNIKHRTLICNIESKKFIYELFGKILNIKHSKNPGRPIEEYLLNRNQLEILIISLVKRLEEAQIAQILLANHKLRVDMQFFKYLDKNVNKRLPIV